MCACIIPGTNVTRCVFFRKFRHDKPSSSRKRCIFSMQRTPPSTIQHTIEFWATNRVPSLLYWWLSFFSLWRSFNHRISNLNRLAPSLLHSHTEISLPFSRTSSEQFYATTQSLAGRTNCVRWAFIFDLFFSVYSPLPFNPFLCLKSQFTISSSVVVRAAAVASRMGHNGGTKSLYDSMLEARAHTRNRNTLHSHNSVSDTKTLHDKEIRRRARIRCLLTQFQRAQLTHSPSSFRYFTSIFCCLFSHLFFLSSSFYSLSSCRVQFSGETKMVREKKTIVTRKTDHRHHCALLCAHNSQFIVVFVFIILFFFACFLLVDPSSRFTYFSLCTIKFSLNDLKQNELL